MRGEDLSTVINLDGIVQSSSQCALSLSPLFYCKAPKIDAFDIFDEIDRNDRTKLDDIDGVEKVGGLRRDKN